MTNSNTKGKVGERNAANYLKTLGYTARRSQQHNGLDGDGDVVIDELPDLHVEVKYGYPLNDFDLGSAKFVAACEQAKRDAKGKRWVVLWKPCRRQIWRLSYMMGGQVVTVAGDEAIRRHLDWVLAGTELRASRGDRPRPKGGVLGPVRRPW